VNILAEELSRAAKERSTEQQAVAAPTTGGTVFKMTSSGKLTTLHSFNGTDGSNAYALSKASDGNFYRTTSTGEVKVDGTTFKITPGRHADRVAHL
jgi:hypothetical protein